MLDKIWTPAGRQIVGLLGAGVIGALIAVLVNAVSRGDADGGDWLQFFGGVIGAAFTVIAAYSLEQARQANAFNTERGNAIAEVLTAADRALEIYGRCSYSFPNESWKSEVAAMFAAEASQLRITLDRLLNRQILTDGAIEVGAGAMILMDIVLSAADIFFEPDGLDFGGRAKKRLASAAVVIVALRLRYGAVEEYGIRKGYLRVRSKAPAGQVKSSEEHQASPEGEEASR